VWRLLGKLRVCASDKGKFEKRITVWIYRACLMNI
jgi:hypothetical protein